MKLLGEMMDTQASPTAAGRLDTALSRGGLSAPGSPLGQILQGLGGAGLGGAGQGQAPATGGGFGDLLNNLLGAAQQGFGQAKEQVQQNNPVAIGGLGALAGAMLGGGKGAVGGGLMAVLGSLAYSALQRANQQQQTPGGAFSAGADIGAAGAGPRIAGGSSADQEAQGTALLMLRAMISAAKADGQIDQGEMERILGKLSEAGSDPEARDFVLSEMRGPLDLDRLVADVRTPQQAAQVYAASLLAIDVDTPAEKDYLDRLARALNLPPQATAHMHGALGVQV
jgi:uncharacterized membrane protein YebE (DUF533 family)